VVHSIGVTPPGPASASIPSSRQVEDGVPGDETRRVERGALRITWVGHSTVLLELDGVRLLTDPVLRTRLAHLRRVGAKVDARSVADVDAALVSHLHYDHLDVPSLLRLGRSVQVVLPAGSTRLLRRRGFTRITQLGVGEELDIGAVTVAATRAEHDGRRTPFGLDRPAVGYLVTGSARIWFAGDTDLFDGMSELAPGLDVALLPIAGWGARLPPGHLDPRTAAEALRLLRPRVAVPIHWGTYRQVGLSRAEDALRAPAESFAQHAAELAPDVDVRLLPVGGTLELQTPIVAGAAP
jgi:L-ascorbate metabolism protein UlaG (beta-lactamase superfamily)